METRLPPKFVNVLAPLYNSIIACARDLDSVISPFSL